MAIAGERSAPITVLSAHVTPPSSLYTDQQLEPGYGYLKTRDGTLLSVNVDLPGPADEGPYPTVVEYSGLRPVEPGRPATRVGDRASCSASPPSA